MKINPNYYQTNIILTNLLVNQESYILETKYQNILTFYFYIKFFFLDEIIFLNRVYCIRIILL